MTSQNPEERSRAVQAMFSRIAPRYDLMNRLMTGGMDVRLRKIVIRKAKLPQNGAILDLGAGTGDLAREALRQYPESQAFAADFTLGMMKAGRKRRVNAIHWSAADALKIPFSDQSFNAVVSGFLLRNVVDIQQALNEQFRVLQSGGIFVSLDTTRTPRSILSPFINFHTHKIIPFLGGLLTGDREAYVYLPTTTDNFLRAEELVVRLARAGFQEIGFKRHMFDTVAIHWAVKP
jgi:demethylmenaquinone methyltransferase/2-methoxy-6-polyprenyl-1,4-benzoquinol methylase